MLMVGDDIQQTSLQESWLDFTNKHAGMIDRTSVANALIDQHIRTTSAFATKHLKLIDAIAGLSLPSSRQLSEKEREHFLSRFINDRAYDVDCLTRDIEKICSEHGIPPPPAVSAPDVHAAVCYHGAHTTPPRYEDENDELVSNDDVRRIFRSQTDAASESAPPRRSETYDAITYVAAWKEREWTTMAALPSMFREVFGRSMLVDEYLWYKGTMMQSRMAAGRDPVMIDVSNDPDSWRRRMEHDKPGIERAWAAAKSTYRTFIGEDIQDDDLMRRYVDVVMKGDAEVAANAVRRDVLCSVAYVHAMTARVRAVHADHFGGGMQVDDADVSIVVEKLRIMNAGLFDDRVQRVVIDHRDLIDAVVTNIYDTYMQVLGRQPDASELDIHVAAHRPLAVAAQTLETQLQQLARSLESQLIRSLEFHDVLKNRIRTTRPELLPSEFYRTLASIINKLSDVDVATELGLEDIEDIVQGAIPS